MSDEELPPGFVVAGDLAYPLEDWVWALNLAALDYLEEHIPDQATWRQVMRGIRSAKSKHALKAVQRATVRKLAELGVEGILPDAVQQAGGVVAGFIPLDKPNPPQ